MQHNPKLQRSMPSASASARGAASFQPKRPPSLEHKPSRRRSSKSKSTSATDALVVSDDPPDHMEELSMIQARRPQLQKNGKVSSRQRQRSRSGSAMSNSSSTSAPSMPMSVARRSSSGAAPPKPSPPRQQHHQQQPQQQLHPPQFLKASSQNQQKHSTELARFRSVSPLSSRPLLMAKTDPISVSNHQMMLPLTREETAEECIMDNGNDEQKQQFRPVNGRQQSPHPADIVKGQSAAAAELKNMHRLQSFDAMMTADSCKNSQGDSASTSQYSIPPSESSSDKEIPTFAISNNLESSESAEELRHLIEAMQNEFQRLRSSKLQAEARAEKLETDLRNQQQQQQQQERMETNQKNQLFESLSMENERLKNDANESKLKLGGIVKKVNQLESENKKLRMAREVAEARAVAAELRASAAEEEGMAVQNSMKALMEMALQNGGGGGVRRKNSSSSSSSRDMRVSPSFRRSKESAFSKPS